MIPFIFKNLRSKYTYYLPSKNYCYGILLMDSDEEVDTNPQLVVINNDAVYSFNKECNLFSNKETALVRLKEMRKEFPQCTYKLIRYALLSN